MNCPLRNEDCFDAIEQLSEQGFLRRDKQAGEECCECDEWCVINEVGIGLRKLVWELAPENASIMCYPFQNAKMRAPILVCLMIYRTKYSLLTVVQ